MNNTDITELCRILKDKVPPYRPESYLKMDPNWPCAQLGITQCDVEAARELLVMYHTGGLRSFNTRIKERDVNVVRFLLSCGVARKIVSHCMSLSYHSVTSIANEHSHQKLPYERPEIPSEQGGSPQVAATGLDNAADKGTPKVE